MRSKVAYHPARRHTWQRPDEIGFSPTEQAYLSCLVHTLTKVKVQIEHCTIDSRSEEQAICKTTLAENRAAIISDHPNALVSQMLRSPPPQKLGCWQRWLRTLINAELVLFKLIDAAAQTMELLH